MRRPRDGGHVVWDEAYKHGFKAGYRKARPDASVEEVDSAANENEQQRKAVVDELRHGFETLIVRRGD